MPLNWLLSFIVCVLLLIVILLTYFNFFEKSSFHFEVKGLNYLYNWKW